MGERAEPTAKPPAAARVAPTGPDRDPPLSIMGTLRWDVVSRLLPRDPDATVLEIGAGQGAAGARLARRYRYTGVEPDVASYEVAAARVAATGAAATGTCRVINGTDADLPAGEQFDLVVTFEVIEHIEDDRAALAGWVRRVRPGGALVLSTPGYQKRFGPSDTAVGHFRRYEPAALAQLLRDSGLVDVRVIHYGMPVAYAIEALRNRVLRRRMAATGPETMAERTSRSGRLLQPRGAVAWVLPAALAPVALLQRVFPGHGPVLVATGRRAPAASGPPDEKPDDQSD